MAHFKLLTSVAAVLAMAGTAQAQVYTQVEAVPTAETEVVRAQFIREGDVSPEEYAALLAEADKIRAFQSNNGQYTGISADTVTADAGTVSTTDSHGYQIEIFEAPMASSNHASAGYTTTVEPVITQSATTYSQPATTYSQPATTYPMAKTYPVGTDFSAPEFAAQSATTSYAATTYSGTSSSASSSWTPSEQTTGTHIIASTQPSVTYSSPVTTYQNTASSSHFVVKGDTLYNIAKRNGTSVTALKAENGLRNNDISLGQTLRIPGAARIVSVEPHSFSAPITNAASTTVSKKPHKSSRPTLVRNVEPLPAGNIYAVASKDTLYSISRRACVSVTDLKAVNNNVEAKALQLGQRLNLPGGHCLR